MIRGQVLDHLFKENVIEVYLEKDGRLVSVSERCDSFYEVKLNKPEDQKMIDELQELVNQMKD